MAIDLVNVSIDKIRKELGVPIQTSVSINTAEDGGYAPINTCSTSKPSATNPATFSEWRNYDHNALCSPNEYAATINDTSAETCNSTFSSSQAAANITIQPAQGVSKNGDGKNDLWYITNISKFPSATIDVYSGSTIGTGNLIYSSTGSTFTPWNLIGNQGSYNGVNTPSGINWFDIQYNDGSGRRIRTWLYISNAETDGYTTLNLYYGATLSAACAATTLGEYQVGYPIQVGSTVRNNGPDPFANIVNLYFKRVDNNTVYRTNSSGNIDLITNC